MLITNDKLLHVATQLLAAKIAGAGPDRATRAVIANCGSDESIEAIVNMAEKLINEVSSRE